MGIKNQEMRSEKRKPYLVIKQASKDYAKTFFKKNLVLWYNEHLLDEFIKKIQLTNSIKKNYLKLIPFDEFEICIILLEKGGYSKVYLASWNNGLYFEAPNNVREFGLQSKKNLKSDRVVARLEYDITEGNISFSFSDKKFLGWVMQYASGGDLLRQYLHDNFVEIDWYQKISILLEIAKGLKAIHNHGYVHRDFHGGNVLLDLSEENEESKYNVTQNMIY
ncbi:hypothetical protein RhiirA1_541680 [Rhizophagus irregularis]|uniref:Protein kinase domain-containing protein n=2 Tax=Rhizophagus irregularis TaxID=588596 RepID=A0A2N0R1W6_9GLOM|nr:hypothetical protein RhiirA1_541680 [Rhizophagus irregularis]